MSDHLQLTKIEAEVVEHRLQFLADADDDDLDELFDGVGLSIEALQGFAEATARGLREGVLVIALSTEEARAALVESIEGATIHHMAVEAGDDRHISQQKVRSYRRALSTVAEKINQITKGLVALP